MDEVYMDKNVAPGIKSLIEKVKANPVHLGNVTCFMVDVTKRKYAAQAQPPASPISTTINEAEMLYSELSNDPTALTVITPELISQYERNFYYHGVSGNPPKLLWRSDLETNPFPIPAPGTNFYKIPTKTASYSALETARFLTVEEGGHESFGPIIVWIAVRPNTPNAEAVRDATPDILRILANVQITDAVVEWYEGSVVSLSGPALKVNGESLV
ncbi:hypothetical protein GGU10DRAFT_395523 [Lentinula aff. detonsa]|uniref:Uncharacterized protein n=1 Tax=Lentinula aff. detonsa TaxID=2804958 RepID=A0AA38NLT1_9AGAR|nr:hypothetical protein GGU10DRAFT_395523 [Lentinula aff. detonsa]